MAAAVPRPARVDGSPTAGGAGRRAGRRGLAAACIARSGGVVDSPDGPDPLLAAAPLLVAAAGTFGVLRIYPLLKGRSAVVAEQSRRCTLVGTARAT